mmetsp:Transcript_13554/g.38399  ORF Transcript_13554/g.38399 Transcript_13554/m.38399 type:complete len:205 (-) Transcript_13554:135-749(-)
MYSFPLDIRNCSIVSRQPDVGQVRFSCFGVLCGVFRMPYLIKSSCTCPMVRVVKASGGWYLPGAIVARLLASSRASTSTRCAVTSSPCSFSTCSSFALSRGFSSSCPRFLPEASARGSSAERDLGDLAGPLPRVTDSQGPSGQHRHERSLPSESSFAGKVRMPASYSCCTACLTFSDFSRLLFLSHPRVAFTTCTSSRSSTSSP